MEITFFPLVQSLFTKLRRYKVGNLKKKKSAKETLNTPQKPKNQPTLRHLPPPPPPPPHSYHSI